MKKCPATRIVVCLLSEADPSQDAPQEKKGRSRSVNATIAALKNSKSLPKATPGTNGMSKGSSLK
jgi:hypothetical protein